MILLWLLDVSGQHFSPTLKLLYIIKSEVMKELSSEKTMTKEYVYKLGKLTFPLVRLFRGNTVWNWYC